MSRRLYLAHPVAIYGTPYKARIVERLRAEGWDVVEAHLSAACSRKPGHPREADERHSSL